MACLLFWPSLERGHQNHRHLVWQQTKGSLGAQVWAWAFGEKNQTGLLDFNRGHSELYSVNLASTTIAEVLKEQNEGKEKVHTVAACLPLFLEAVWVGVVIPRSGVSTVESPWPTIAIGLTL